MSTALNQMIRRNAGIGPWGDIGVSVINTKNIGAVNANHPIVEKKAGGVEITTTPKKITK